MPLHRKLLIALSGRRLALTLGEDLFFMIELMAMR